MTGTAETRELFELNGANVIVRGTFHRADEKTPARSVDPSSDSRVGIVFLNSTSPTRAANGDAAVYLAERFAASGFPTFRLDLPGFGDSEGDPPPDLTGFINRGGYAAIASQKLGELKTRFNLSGIVLAGHCAGSVSSLYTAALSDVCCGLIMIGPYFHLPQVKKVSRIRRQLNMLALRGRPWNVLSGAYNSFSKLWGRFRWSALPENANHALLRSWKRLATTGVPILILKGADRKSAGGRAKAGEFDYFTHLLKLAGAKGNVTVGITEGANNAFASRGGLIAIEAHAKKWLGRHFPLPEVQSPGPVFPAEARRSGNDCLFANVPVGDREVSQVSGD